MIRSFSINLRRNIATHFVTGLALVIFAIGTGQAEAQTATSAPNLPSVTYGGVFQGVIGTGALNKAECGQGGLCNGSSWVNEMGNLNMNVNISGGPNGPCDVGCPGNAFNAAMTVNVGAGGNVTHYFDGPSGSGPSVYSSRSNSEVGAFGNMTGTWQGAGITVNRPTGLLNGN